MLIQRDGVTLEYDDPETLVVDGLERCIKCERVLVGEEKGTCRLCEPTPWARIDEIETRLEEISEEEDELAMERDALELELKQLERKRGGY